MVSEAWWADEFPVSRNLIYLNHAGICPLPLRTARAITDVAEDFRDFGKAHYARWRGEVMPRARARLAELLGANEEEVAFTRSTTAGLLLVAESIPVRAGDNVVVADIEFPANVYPWQNLERKGVQVRFVPGRERPPTADDYARLCDARTRAIAVSWVQFATGQRTDLGALAELAHRSGGYLAVDGIQGLGALRLDADALGIDFLSADGHKWLLSVEGAGVLYVSRRALADIEPFWRGWLSVPDPNDYLGYGQPARVDAARFEEGSPNLLGAAALDASVGLLLEVGPAEIERRVLTLTDRVIDGARRLGCAIVSPLDERQRSGIVCFRHPRVPAEEIVRGLEHRGIACAARLGAVRFSPHFYNTTDEVDRALAAVAELI